MANQESGGLAKEAGIIVYLQEELTDARLRCDQLKKLVDRAARHIAESTHREHFYEVAGDLIYGIPDALFRLDKALAATALAATRIDYEELKQELKPEKVDMLEQVLKNVRIRQLDRRAIAPQETNMFKAANTDHISSALRRIADQVDNAGVSPREASLRLCRVLLALSQTPEQSTFALNAIAPKTAEDARNLVAGANPTLTSADIDTILVKWAGQQKDEGKDSRFQEGKPADPTENMSPEDAKRWKEEHEKNKDQFKTARASDDKIKRALTSIEQNIKDIRHHLTKAEDNRPHDDVGVLFNEIRSVAASLARQMDKSATEDEDKRSKFEEGKPADPTENMSPEDAKKWKLEHLKNQDNFKA